MRIFLTGATGYIGGYLLALEWAPVGALHYAENGKKR